MDDQQQPRWRPTKPQILWSGGMAAVFAILVLIGYRYGITIWDWIKLLIVPAAIAGVGIWFNRQQRARELESMEHRAQDEALQAYLDQMGHLLLERNLRSSDKDSEVRTLARARTFTVLDRLDGKRRGSVIRFLHEARLIDKDDTIVYLTRGNHRANLNGADLRGADLHGANLSGVLLYGADLLGAILVDANLSGAFLDGANLHGAFLNGADLRYARGIIPR